MKILNYNSLLAVCIILGFRVNLSWFSSVRDHFRAQLFDDKQAFYRTGNRATINNQRQHSRTLKNAQYSPDCILFQHKQIHLFNRSM